MNTLTRSVLTTTLTLISAFTWAQSNADVTVTVNATVNFDGNDFVKKLTEDNLVISEGKLAPSSRAVKVLQKLSYGVPPGNEGIVGREPELDVSDILNQEYPLSLFLRESIDQAARKPMGRRILFYEGIVTQVIERGNKPQEEAVRLVLNRSVDIVQNNIRWFGQNSDYVAQYATQFYAQNFEMALMYANNPPNIDSEPFPRASIGIRIARMLFDNHAGLITDASKAIILIKTLGYLGQDLNSDVRRRAVEFSVPLRKIVHIQKYDEAYNNVLNSLGKRQEPNSADLASLRSQVGQLLKTLPNN